MNHFRKNLVFFQICIFSALTALVLSACGIPDFEIPIKLNAPLGLNAEMESNVIKLTFWGLNDEPFFEGYQIYMTDDSLDIKTNGGNIYPNPEGYTNKPTLYNINPVSNATKYTFYVSNNYDGSELILSNTYYFTVRAYSQTYNFYSLPSNPTNVQYLTNRFTTDNDSPTTNL